MKKFGIFLTFAMFVLAFSVFNVVSSNGDFGERDILELINSHKEEKKGEIKEDVKETFIEEEVHRILKENDRVMVIVKLKGDLKSKKIEEVKEAVIESQERVLTLLEEDEESEFEIIYKYEVLNGFAGFVNFNGLRVLEESGLVEAVYSEKILETSLSESVPLINADDVWQINSNSGSITGQGQTVCVVDSGIDYTHPDLGGCIGRNCKVKGGMDFFNLDFDPMDDNGHGTHVAGIVASNGNIKGVAPDAELIAVKSCDSSASCSGSAMIAGVDYCISNIHNLGTDVITMSIGDHQEYGPNSGTCPTWMDFSIDFANFMGLPVTIASGNEAHKNGISYPACSPNAISVGATYDEDVGSKTWCTQRDSSGNCIQTCTDSTTNADQVICFTNSGNNLDVMAPGAVTSSTAMGGGAVNLGGTSMATPHVAGTIALIKQISPLMTPSEIESRLESYGEIVRDSGNNLDFSRVDSLKAVNSIMQTPWGPEYELDFGEEILVDLQNNVHVLYLNSGNLFYKKMDNHGNILRDNVQITNVISGKEKMKTKIDGLDNIHIVWVDDRDGNLEIYYMKIDNNGNVVVNEMRLTNESRTSTNPDLDVDELYNAHVVWQDDRFTSGRWRILYDKIDRNGNVVVNERIVDNPDLSCGSCPSRVNYARYPIITVDSNQEIHLTYQFYRWVYSSVSNAYDDLHNYRYYHKKLDNDGNSLSPDTIIYFSSFRGTSNAANIVMHDAKMDSDEEGNFYILRNRGIRTISWNPGGSFIFSIIYYDNNLTLTKYNSAGAGIGLWTISGDAGNVRDLAVDKDNNVHIFWDDEVNNLRDIYYTKIDRGGNVVNERVKVSDSPSSVAQSASPNVEVDLDNEAHLLFSQSGKKYYKRTLSNYNLEIPFDARIGTTIPLHIYDENSKGEFYVIGLSFGYSPGLNIGGRILPLNPDDLFLLSLRQSSPISSNFNGNLDLNGRATGYLTVPNDPSLVGAEMYAAFVTINNSGFSVISPRFPIEIKP
jgi:subtilisin family serine protease